MVIMKRNSLLLTSIASSLFIALTGMTAFAEAITENSSAAVPAFTFQSEYPDSDVYQAICDWLVERGRTMYLYEDVDATVPVIADVAGYDDEEQAEFYGSFSVYNFHANGKLLEVVSGGTDVGMVKVVKQDGTWVVDDAETQIIMDEDPEALEEICRKHEADGVYQNMTALLPDDDYNKALDIMYIKMYVEENDLPYMEYTLGGDEVIQLYDGYSARTYVETPAEDDNPCMNIVGSYVDSYSGRAYMDIACEGADGAAVVINWGDGAAANMKWVFHGTMDADGAVHYTSGRKIYETYDENGEMSENIRWEDGTGTFTLQEDGTITWQDDKDDQGHNCKFEFYSGY